MKQQKNGLLIGVSGKGNKSAELLKRMYGSGKPPEDPKKEDQQWEENSLFCK